MTLQQTSLFAFRDEIQPDLPRRQRIVLEAFKEHGDMTDRELRMRLGWEINAVTPRRGELVEAGLLKAVATRPCKVTGRTARVWGIINEARSL